MTETLEQVNVIYCGKCGMPPEFCEYGPDFESHCDPWLKKHQPALFAELARLRKTDGDDQESDDEVAAKEERPAEPWTIEERLVAFYEKYQSDKLDNVPQLLEKYAGKEEKLFTALVKKYGDEPEDPYYADSDDEEEIDGAMENLTVDGKKRRGAKAKRSGVVETRVVVQKIARQKRKTTTVVIGMETIPGLKLKDASKAFSKRFAGSSSVKDSVRGKEIILQGDHMEDVAEMIVSKFKAPASAVFLDMEGEFVAFG